MNNIEIIHHLPCWHGNIEVHTVSGGITNANYHVQDGQSQYFVRVGDDIPLHGVMRFNELAASQAACVAGVSPAVVYHQAGVMVLNFIDGKTLTAEDICRPENLERIVPLIKHYHQEIPRHLRGPSLVFWVFQVVRDYANTLRDDNSRMLSRLPHLLGIADKLESAVGAVQLVFSHNDLLAANFIDDEQRLWLIDWDYAGFNSPLFDLGGLASNNALTEQQERWMLEQYFESPVNDELEHRYNAMKCASLLRESMWSMVSENHSSLDFDYEAYTEENLRNFEAAWEKFNA